MYHSGEELAASLTMKTYTQLYRDKVEEWETPIDSLIHDDIGLIISSACYIYVK
jgi:hypothetical protein